MTSKVSRLFRAGISMMLGLSEWTLRTEKAAILSGPQLRLKEPAACAEASGCWELALQGGADHTTAVSVTPGTSWVLISAKLHWNSPGNYN